MRSLILGHLPGHRDLERFFLELLGVELGEELGDRRVRLLEEGARHVLLANRRRRSAQAHAQLAVQELVRELAGESLELLSARGALGAKTHAYLSFGRARQEYVAAIDEEVRSAVDGVERVEILVDV